MIRRVPWYPAVVVTAFVMFNLADTGVHAAAAGRALLVGVVTAVLVQMGLSLLFRNRHTGAAVAGSLTAVILFWVPITAVSSAVTRLHPLQMAVLAALVGILLTYSIWMARRGYLRLRQDELTRSLNAVSAVLLAIAVASLATAPIGSQLLRDLGFHDRSDATTASRAGPSMKDIYLIILDGHPREDALREHTGHSYAGFTSALETLGFMTAPRAHANYNWTSATLISLFEMEPLDPLPPVDALRTRTAVSEALAFELLRDRGFETVAIGPPAEHVALREADRFIDAGYLNSFECHLIRRTGLGAAAWAISPSLVGDARRSGVERSLAEARAVASERDGGPRFVVVHLPVPHLPVLWAENGMPVDDPLGSDCAPQDVTGMDRDRLERAYVGGLDYLHDIVLDAVRDILRGSEAPPVLLILSDHGAHFGGPEPDPSDPGAWRDEFGILFAAHTPQQPDLFPADVSLVNALPIVFNSYLGTDLELHDDAAYWSTGVVAVDPDAP